MIIGSRICRQVGLVFLMVSLLVARPVKAQHQATANDSDRVDGLLADRITNALVEIGFENISVVEADRRVVATFEDRVYRYDIQGVQKVIQAVMPLIGEGSELVLIPLRRGMQIETITVPAASYHAFIRREISKDVFINTLEVSLENPGYRPKTRGKSNRTTLKTDVILRPQLVAEFGNFDEPVETQVNLIPEVSLMLWRGAHLTGQIIIPLQNELAEEGDNIRPGLLTWNQTVRGPSNLLASMSLGYFSHNRYGFDGEARKYVYNGRIAAGIRLGYTGFLNYRAGEWLYGDLEILTYAADIIYQVVPEYNLTLQATYAKFLFGDKGWRFDAHRTFGEFEIGFYGILSRNRAGSNAGARVTIPLPFRKHMRPSRVRIRSAERFQWAYRYRNLPLEGMLYQTGNGLENFWGQLSPAFLKNRLSELKDW